MTAKDAHRAGVALALSIVLVFPLISSATAHGRPSSGQVPADAATHLLIGFDARSDPAALLEAVNEAGGRTISVNREAGFIAVTGMVSPANARNALSSVASLRYMTEDTKAAKTFFIPNDEYFETRQWAPQRIEADLAWDLEKGSKSVVVAVLDTGVDYNHPDIAANIWTDGSGYHGYDFVNGDNDPLDDNNKAPNPSTGVCEPNDIYHGTNIAGIVGAVMNNLIGIAGIAQVSIMAVKVLDDCGEGYLGDIASGITYAADHGAQVMTLSLGYSSDNQAIRDAVRYAFSKGTVIVAAAGNDGGAVSYPAAYPEVISVGSTDYSNMRSTFSSFGTALDIMAPGENIWSCMGVSPFYQSMTGTSQSAPHVAGVAALVLSRNPSLTNVQVASILNSSATDLGTPGYDTYYGWGLVDAFRAVQDALAGGLNATILSVPEVRGLAGTWVTLSATLKGRDGSGIGGKPLNFTVDSSFLGTSVTDSRGIASYLYTLPGLWGWHRLRVAFAGDASYAPSSRETNVVVVVPGSGNITGVVLADKTFERIPFATVSLPSGRMEVIADSKGLFVMTDVAPGGWDLSVSVFGYETANLNATVTSGETLVLSVVLRTQVGMGEALTVFPFLALFVALALIATFATTIFAAHRASKARLRMMVGGVSPPEIPAHVASWLAEVHGIDARRFIPVEVMPVAEGHQLTLMDVTTNNVIVVRVDIYGRPVYLFLTPPYFHHR